VQKCMDLFIWWLATKIDSTPTLLKLSCYKSALKTHDTFKCDRCAPKHVISWYRCTSKTCFEDASTLQCIKNYHCKVHFGSFFSVLSNVKNWAKTKHWNDVKVDIFFHVQVKGTLFSTFMNTSI
jgi:hypothetical protein